MLRIISRRILAAVLAIAALGAGQSAKAQIFETTYTVTAGSKMDGIESCQKLLDGDINTKWCEACQNYGNSFLYVEFHTDKPFVPTGYILTTAYDNVLNNYRYPTKWKLQGRLNETDNWTTLSYVDNDNALEDKNLTPYEFGVDNSDHKQYQFFRFEIYKIRSFYSGLFQLAEFQFKGYTDLKKLNDAVVTGIQPVYDYNNGESIPVDYTVQDALGNTIDPSNYNAYFDINEEVVTSVGLHTLTLNTEGMTNNNGYHGIKRVQFWVKPQLSGAGTEASPYLISTNHDWNLFAERVRLGDTYKGKFVKLAANIDVLWMAGSSEVCSFQGTFDGGGNTMTLHLTAEEDACAPFRYLKDAKIMNLNIAGTVESAYSYAASLAAYGYGTCVITNCGSTAEIRSTRSNGHKDFHGGFIAVFYPKLSLTFTDCVFAGKMTGGNSWGVGGFVGYSFATVYYNHCLFAASEFTMDKKNSYTFNGNSDYSKFNGNYTTMNIDIWYGTKVYDNTDQLSKVEFDYQGTKYYTRAAYNIEGIESSYDETGSVIDITPKVSYDHQLLVEGQDYEVTTNPSPVQAAGNYTMSITGIGDYAGTETRSFRVNYIFKETGTEENPYLIPHSAAWETFAANIQNGMDYAGKYVKLTDDFDNSATPITVTAGSDKHRFKGTFLGNNRTLHINLSGKNKYLAPFSYIENATIRDLTVTGTITSTVEGDGTHGGFAGVNNGNSTFTNCTFTGSMLGEKTTSCGGFVGWTNGNLTYTDCVFAPAEITISNNGCATFNRNGKNTLTQCYYTTPLGKVQGVQVTTDANTVHATGQILIGGVNYYRKCDISGIEKGYKYTGSVIAVTPVVTFEGQTLVENTDYTVTYTNSYDEEVEANAIDAAGKYSITITGNGNYTGTYATDFYIVDKEILAGYLFQKGRDDEGEYYEISSVDNWNTLGSLIANEQAENVTNGMRFKLTDNISVTSMIGINEDTHSFQGIFDGGGHTLTIDLCEDWQFLSPFRYLKNATIRNLTVDGTIRSKVHGDATTGGFAGINNGNSTFENCVFSGSLLAYDDWCWPGYCGGFVGYNKGQLHYIDCLFAPAEITIYDSGSATFNRNGNNDFVRTYYLTPFGENQGTRVFAAEVENAVCRSVTAADGNTYYVALCFPISSETDWKKFAESVENEDDLVKEYPVVLLSDITVTTTVGSQDHPFKGKFLGNGKTITVNLESTDLRVMAPFRFVDQALIQNLTIAGTIKYTEQDQEGACGGIVGVNYGYTTLNKCIFTGSLLKGDNTPPDDAATSYYGGFVGWNTRSITIRDCLFNPTEITVSDEHAATFYNNDYSTLPRAYYLTPFGKTQGCRVYAREEDVPADVTVFPETFFNGTTYYVESGLKVDNTIAADQPGHYYINMPTEGIEYYTIPAGIRHFKVYDDGGKDGKASEYCDADLVLTVPSGCLIQATGTVTTCDYRGKVALYDGDSYWDDEFDSWDSYPYYGEPEWVDPVVTTGESMDIYFRADYDADTDASNLDLVVSVIDMPLQDKANNDALIAANSGKLVNAALTGRKLYVDNDWNTICLPFSLSKEQIDASLLMGCVIKELDTDASNYEHPTGYHNGTLYLNFKDAETIEAGKPYLIKWSKHKVYNYGIPDPGFVDVTVTATTPAAITSSDGYVSFVGTYSPTDIFSADKTNLYVGSNNKLHYPWANNMQHFYLNACRGYFRLNKGLTAGDPSAVKEFRLNFGEDEPLSIINFQLSIGEADGWYDLSGRKLGGKPTKRGLYIHNGEKIAIK